MNDHGLLDPGFYRVAGVADDRALAVAMARVEVAWYAALAEQHAATPAQYDVVVAVAGKWQPDLTELSATGEEGGNPVLPFINGLRRAVEEHDPNAAAQLHRGLTSQDVLDSALMTLASDIRARVLRDLAVAMRTTADLAVRHRDSVMAGRTLTQHAVPITFGLKAAQWLAGLLDAAERLTRIDLPVQCGGAAGTLALAGELVADVDQATRTFARELDLASPELPWHIRRSPVTALGDALVSVCDALGTVASDISILGRPEIAELSEGSPGGGSSTMPHKDNPVLSILVRSAAQQAPLLAAQLHLAAGGAVDERPDGAWHAEWAPLRRLLLLAATAASQAVDLVSGLVIDAQVMAARAEASADELLAERGGEVHDPSSYLGSASVFVDRAVARLHRWEQGRG